MTPGTVLRFRSSKISPSIPLEKVASFFQLQRASSWKEYIVLQGPQLEEILKRQSGPLQAYLFEFGCITFVNFEEADVSVFLEFIAGLTEGIDYEMVARFSESHTILVQNPEEIRPFPESGAVYRYEESFIPLISILLAKSSAMNKIELDVESSIDESERYLNDLNRGKLRMNKRSLMSVVSKFLKFEYESIHNIRIFDRSLAEELNLTLNGRRLYDAFSEYMEINDRFDVLQSKIHSLRSTMKSYHKLSHRHMENRLYWFEIFLLGLFPIAGLIHLLW
ncbi:RMD1 family protein [Gorillibacterium sp. sgz5001074]|uniref:RMD1 family protein n=1 Tax=Gorillibacterium sp. sgz5001074 TaxID=3446695 RepID=UPI003F671B2B